MAVDPMYGTVFVIGFFDHSGTVHDYALANGKQLKGAGIKETYTHEMGEAFRIENGKIRMVEANMTRAPYGMSAGWPKVVPPQSAPRTAAAGQCNLLRPHLPHGVSRSIPRRPRFA